MIFLKSEIKKDRDAPSSVFLNKRSNPSPLSYNWIGGFTDGDGTFSISNYKPRLKFENHIKELPLFFRIKEALNNETNIIITKPRKNRPNSNATVCLDITNIHFLKNKVVPIFTGQSILKSKKLKDFKDWAVSLRASRYLL